MNKEKIKKELHQLIDRLSDSQLMRLYQLVRGMFGGFF